MKNIVAITLSALVTLALLGYMAFWYVMADRIAKEINYQYYEAAAQGITITGGLPRVTGFPRAHKIIFSGSLQKENWTLNIPQLEITGFLLPGQTIVIEMPKGASLSGIETPYPDLWSLSYIYIEGVIPEDLPYAATVEALRAWRALDGAIRLEKFRINKDSLRLSGTSNVHLDNNLQPEGEFNVRIEGHMAFLSYLQSRGLLENKEALITATVFTGLSKQDPETGERYLETPITLQNRKLLLGPLELFDLPQFRWGYDNLPAQLQ
jgi:hypothetical protein